MATTWLRSRPVPAHGQTRYYLCIYCTCAGLGRCPHEAAKIGGMARQMLRAEGFGSASMGRTVSSTTCQCSNSRIRAHTRSATWESTSVRTFNFVKLAVFPMCRKRIGAISGFAIAERFSFEAAESGRDLGRQIQQRMPTERMAALSPSDV
jgi:hypothetical protein